MENITAAQRNKMALKYGLLVSVIYILVSSVVNIFIANLIVFYVSKFIGYMLFFVIIGYFAASIRKANGGYIEFREVFGAIFIMILTASTISYLYNYIYILYIDTHYMEKLKSASIHYMEKMNMPESKLDETAQKFDEQIEEAKHFNLKRNILTLSGAYLLDSLFGLIVAAIVKKQKPIFDSN